MASVFCRVCGNWSLLNRICKKCNLKSMNIIDDSNAKNTLVVDLGDYVEYTFNPSNLKDKSNDVLSWDDKLL